MMMVSVGGVGDVEGSVYRLIKEVSLEYVLSRLTPVEMNKSAVFYSQ